jgi:hypothetical protein
MPQTHRLNPLWQIVVGNRPMLFALSVSVLLLLLLFQLTFCRDRRHAIEISWITGFLLGGVLPAIQHQAFFAMLVFTFFHCSFQCTRQHFLHVFLNLIGAAAVSFAALNLYRYSDGNFLNTFSISPVWEWELQSGCLFPMLRYFWSIGGVFPFICLVAPWFYLGIIERQFFFAFVFTVIVLSYWRLQIRPEDNIFAFYSLLYTLGSVMFILVTYRAFKAQRSDDRKGLMIGVMIVMIVSMSVSVIAGMRSLLHWTECWNLSDEEVAIWIRENTPIDAVFFYDPIPLHFIAVLTGRQNFCGNSAVLESEGFQGNKCIEEIKSWGLSLNPSVQYVVSKDDEQDPLFVLNKSKTWRIIYHKKGRIIFERTDITVASLRDG